MINPDSGYEMTPEQTKLRTRAFRQVEGAYGARHLFPRAYCVAKLSLHMAVFAVPPRDREECAGDDPSVLVTNYSCRNVKLGDWCSLAYVHTGDSSENYVVYE